MTDLYDAIKAKFDAEATLGGPGGPFTELHLGEVAAGVDVPFCTLIEPEEPSGEGAMGGRVFVDETFSFAVVESTFELAQDRAEALNAVFDAQDSSLVATGLDDIRLTKIGQRRVQVDEDRWVVSLSYRATYWRTRP